MKPQISHLHALKGITFGMNGIVTAHAGTLLKVGMRLTASTAVISSEPCP